MRRGRLRGRCKPPISCLCLIVMVMVSLFWIGLLGLRSLTKELIQVLIHEVFVLQIMLL